MILPISTLLTKTNRPNPEIYNCFFLKTWNNFKFRAMKFKICFFSFKKKKTKQTNLNNLVLLSLSGRIFCSRSFVQTSLHSVCTVKDLRQNILPDRPRARLLRSFYLLNKLNVSQKLC